MPKAKTAKKSTARRNLYLALTIVFFLAIIAVFVLDGYMGIYDTVTVTAGERENTVEPDQWLHEDYSYYTWVESGEKLYFHYELANRRFTSYEDHIEAAVWFGGEKQEVLLNESVSLGAFEEEEFSWAVDPATVRPYQTSADYDIEFSVIIMRGGVELRTVVHASFPKPSVE
ncbi:MAG: hypothetical protein PVJ61_08060 [Dehalococcoidia bacterium]|jgi:hypothetical protein